MKRHSQLLTTLLVVLAAWSCNYTEQSIEPMFPKVEIPQSIYARLDEDTRTQLIDESKVVWLEGDQISYFPGVDANIRYTYSGDGGRFDSEQSGSASGRELKRCYAIYPYSESNQVGADGTLSLNIPSVQNYAEGSFGDDSNPLVAATESCEDHYLRLKNVCGYLKIQLYGSSTTISKVELTGNNNEPISGEALVTVEEQGEVSVTMKEGASKNICIESLQGIRLSTDSSSPTSFLFALPQTTFSKGFTIKATDTDGDIFTKSTQKEIIVDRNLIQPMKCFEVELEDGDNLPLHYPLVSTQPKFVTENSTDDIVLTLNAANSSMANFTGDIYAHTGVITSASSSLSDWRYIKASWSENRSDCKLRSIGNNLWQLTLKGGVRSFYGIPQSIEVEKLAFVFRSADGSKEIKSANGDIFIDVVSDELMVDIVSPSDGDCYRTGNQVVIQVNQNRASEVSLYKNGEMIKCSSAGSITYAYTPNAGEDVELRAVATDGEQSVEKVVRYSVIGSTQYAARPSGISDGVTISGNSATFALYAPGKSSVFVIGDWNNYSLTHAGMMKRDGDYFWTKIEGLSEGVEYGYQYLIDESIRVADPYSKKVLDPWNDKWISSSTYPNLKPYPEAYTSDIVSVFELSPTAYQWQVEKFTPAPKNSVVIYELLLRDFTSDGTVRAATQKLDYLQNLGITAIELMPIQEFDGNDSWGYNPCFYFAPDKAYGTSEDYKYFIDECHKRGIAVILDVVINHATGLFPWAKMWWDSSANTTTSQNPFFNRVARHPYNVYHDLNHEYWKTRSYFKDMLKYWIREYKVDGYRFDLSKGLTQTNTGDDVGAWSGYDGSRIAIIKDYANAIREVSSSAYIILEHFADWWEENELACHKDILLWNNECEGYYQTVMGYNSSSDLKGSEEWGRVSYFESHDEERTAYKAVTWGQSWVNSSWSRLSKQIQGAYAIHLLSPYPKMMWQFGELGYDVSIEDNGRTGKKPAKWEYYNNSDRRAIYNAIGKILKWRAGHKAMYSHNDVQCNTFHASDGDFGGKHLVYSTAEGSVIVVSNFSNSHVEFDIAVPKSGVWQNLMSGASISLGSNYHVSLNGGEYVVLVKD